MTEERKLVTVLFADIVGSTAATAEEDPEVVRTTLGRAFREMRELLSAHGGTVEKFIGDAVMCVFGMPQVHDDDAERAVRAAFALQAKIGEMSDRLAFPLGLRIGVNTGRVVTGSEGADTLVTGAPVNAAARLQQAASPGEIVVGQVTHELTRSAVRYAPSRTVEAKGLGTLAAHRAEALLDAVPEQHRGLGELRAPLIGRDLELRLLRDAWERARSERSPSLVTIYGQPGVGKSRLVAELVEVIGANTVRRGRCLSYGSGITYWPLQEIVRADADVAGDDPLEVARVKIRAATLAAFDEASEDAETVAARLELIAGITRAEEAPTGVTGDELSKELRWAARRYFELRAQRSPLALVFDDIQWAEPVLFDLIEHLAERSRAPLLVLCMTRPELREKRPAWGSVVKNSTNISVEPLDPSETRRLIGALLSIDDLADDLRAEIVRRAEGNPLYVEELLRMLLETGQVERRDGRFVARGKTSDLAIPPTLEGLLAARLDQLDADAKRAIRLASVVGQVFYPGALVALGVADRDLDGALESAQRRDLVLELDDRGPDGRASWSFKHLLIRDAAYESLPKAERWRSHDALGRWLASVPAAGDLGGVIAHHAERAFWTARELRAEEADALGRRALGLALEEAKRAEQLRSGAAQRLALWERVLALSEAAGADEDVRLEARAMVAVAKVGLDGGGLIAGVEELLPLARSGGPSRALFHLLTSAGYWRHGGGHVAEEGNALYAEAAEVARALRDPRLTMEIMDRQAEVEFWQGRLEREGAIREEILRLARQVGDDDVELRQLTTLFQANLYLGRLEVAHGYAEEFMRRAPESRAPSRRRELFTALLAFFRARMAGSSDQALAAALRRLELGVEFGEGPGWVAWGHALVARAQLWSGRPAEALAEIETALGIMQRQGFRGFVGEFRQVGARALLGVGRLEDARSEAELAYREITDDDPASRHTTALALALVREAEGDLDEAERLLRQSIDCTVEYRWLAAEGRLEFAQFLMRHGRHAEARPLLDAARDFYVLPRAKGWRDRVEALIRESEAAIVG